MSSMSPNTGAAHELSAKETLQSLLSWCIALLILETLFVLLRLVSRLVVKKQELGWDDFLIAPAYLACVGEIIASICKFLRILTGA